jgi:hypothetical protein
MINENAAHTFLQQSRSPFLRQAGHWVMHWDDPSDILLALAGDVGQRLGPFETFRTCALLGLARAASVQELGLDVLVEPPQRSTVDGPPAAHAIALGHAHDLWPKKRGPYAEKIRDALVPHVASTNRMHSGNSCAALLALTGEGGISPCPPAHQLAREKCLALLQSDLTGTLACMVWEISFLNQSTKGLRSLALNLLQERQHEDGGLLPPSEHILSRGFMTLRALALVKRDRYGSPHSATDDETTASDQS